MDKQKYPEPVVVAVVTNPLEANLCRTLLESYGIPAYTRSPTILSWREANVSPIGDIHILVPASRAEEALTLLKASQDVDLDADQGEDGRRFREAAQSAAMEAETEDFDPHP